MGPHCGPGFRKFPPHHLLSHRLRGEGGASAPKGGGPAGPVGTERVQRVQRVQKVQKGRIAAFGGNNYKVSVTGLAFVSLWRPRHFERRYKPVWFHSFMEPVKGSPEISLQKAALRQSVQHRVSFLRLPSYTLSRCAGLPLKGKQGLAAELAMCCLSPAKHSAEFATPLWCLTATPFSTGKRLTWFSGRYHSPTNQVRLPPRCAGAQQPAGHLLPISCTKCRAARISPSGGDAAEGGRRGAFPSRCAHSAENVQVSRSWPIACT